MESRNWTRGESVVVKPDVTDPDTGRNSGGLRCVVCQSLRRQAIMGKFDTSSPRRAQVDAKAVRRQVRSILHSLDRMRSSEAYWQVGAVANEVRQLLEQGWTLIQADDGRSALALLEAITEAYVADWTNLDDSDGEASGFFQDLGPIWTEAYGRAHLETANEALTLARGLYDRGEREQGLQIAEEGLLLQGPKVSLAKWLRDESATMGEETRALTAAEVAFREELSLANYLRVAEIAGEQWPERRANLLEYVRHTKSYVPQGQVDVFLHEGLIDDAIAAVEPKATHTLVERVVNAAMQSHPAWVIKVCRQQAEPFMDEGKAQYYRTAANWLAKARTAYRNMGREEEWRTYLSELLDRHQRKYKLVPMLEALR